jgi:hypothetical protein
MRGTLKMSLASGLFTRNDQLTGALVDDAATAAGRR